MATVRDFDVGDLTHVRPHEEVDAIVRCIECDGEKLIQIDTYGGATRDQPNKLSQTIRLDKSAFEKLLKVGALHF